MPPSAILTRYSASSSSSGFLKSTLAYGASLMFPNDEMPYAVAATTWTNILGCKTFKGRATLDAIRAFGEQTWGKFGGEPVHAFVFTGPTPAEPEGG